MACLRLVLLFNSKKLLSKLGVVLGTRLCKRGVCQSSVNFLQFCCFAGAFIVRNLEGNVLLSGVSLNDEVQSAKVIKKRFKPRKGWLN